MFIAPFLAFLDGSTWQNMFFLDAEQVTWAEKIIRPVLVYVSLIVLLRIVGKRELAQLNPLDLVVILSLSNTVQNAIIGNDTSLIGGVVGAVALLGVNSLFAYMKFRSKSVESILEGRPVKIIERGKLDEKQLSRELMTESDIDIIAHENGMDDRHEIDRLVLDPNGTFLVEGKDEIKDAKFKRDVLKKIDELSKQLSDLNSALKQTG
ncbi:MAG: YetF domain-containing protein [Pyrinomonadaceae bacterium]